MVPGQVILGGVTSGAHCDQAVTPLPPNKEAAVRNTAPRRELNVFPGFKRVMVLFIVVFNVIDTR